MTFKTFRVNCFLCIRKNGLSMHSKSKLRTYCLIKNNYKVKRYVRQTLTKSQRSLCAQLSSGTSPLVTETGRFNATPEGERLCALSALEEIGKRSSFLCFIILHMKILLRAVLKKKKVFNQGRFLLAR